jgi:hypothetical protein
LPVPEFTDEDHGLRPVDEAQAGQLPDARRGDLGSFVEAEVLEPLQAGEVGLGDAAVPAALASVLQLGFQHGGEEAQVALALPECLR